MLLIAKILLSIQIVLLMALVGAVVAFFGLILFGTLMGASTMEGGLAMGAAGLAPLGGVAGAGVGIWLAWRAVTRGSREAILLGGYGLFGFAALTVGGWFLVEELTDGNPYDNDKEPTVHLEWRLPERVNHAHVDRIFRKGARSTYQDWSLTTLWDNPRARDEGDHTILRFQTKIRWRVTGRTFQLWRAPHHNDRITVDLGLPKDPEASAEYGPWKEVESAPGNAFRLRVHKP